MAPQITCPHCGNTINLENRKEVDFEKIMYALNSAPKSFTELLEITSLPRKTLSLRLKDLCNSGSIVKDGGYRLGVPFSPNKKIYTTKNGGNGKMNGRTFHIGKNVQWIPAALIICLVVFAFGSAIKLAPPASGPNPPMANFVYGSSSGIAPGTPLRFDASTSSVSSGYISSYFWSFGDGGTDSGVAVTHVYAAEGQYTVTLEVTDNLGTTSTKTYTVNVANPAQPGPIIKFAIFPDINKGEWENKYFVDKTLTFDASAFNQANGFMTNYSWDFGDGSTATGAMVSHAYAQPGSYNVQLTVAKIAGGSQTVGEEVTVLPVPTTVIYVSGMPSQPEIGQNITLSIMISKVTDMYAWQTGMTFNSAVLRCILQPTPSNVYPNATSPTSAFVEGDFLKQGGRTMWYPGTVGDGVISMYGDSLMGSTTPVAGNGTLATVTFQVIGNGPLDIHLTDVKISNIDGIDIPVYAAT